MKYEHWTRTSVDQVEEIFKVTDTGEVLDCGEAANRLNELDAKVMELYRELESARDRYNRDVLGLNNEGDAIGGEPPRGLRHMAEDYIEFRRTIKEIVQGDLPPSQIVQAIWAALEPDGPDSCEAGSAEWGP